MNPTKLLPMLLACAGVSLTAAGCAGAIDDTEHAQSTSEALSSCLPEIPAAIAVPDGNRLAFTLLGDGVQIYACQATASGQAWVFQEPQANLYWKNGFLAGSHYKGPTWEALDGSTVVGTKLAAATVDATAIPWLLLQGTSHTGKGLMDKVTYVQRLETVGGLAPAAGCDANHVGATADVAYTATYAFYVAKGHAAH
jgi:hypothetical protein